MRTHTKSVMVPIDQVSPYFRNVKLHSTPQVRKIADSIATYGFDQPIVVDSEYVIIKGHGRYEAAKLLGWAEVPVIVNTDLTPEEVMASRIADNKVAESAWDEEALYEEMTELRDEGITFRDLGFDVHSLGRILEGKANEFISGDEEPVDEQEEEPDNKPSGFIAPHVGEDEYLNHLSMQDYLNLHDKILIGFSSGKDSLASAIWCLENCERDKLVFYYTNPGWGVDWPHSLAYIALFEEQYGVKVHRLGSCDPYKFEDVLIQMGFPSMIKGCWVESHVKIPQTNEFMRINGFLPKSGKRYVQVISIRAEEGGSRSEYPERGYLKDTKNDYCSPVFHWTDADIAKFLAERGVKLHSAYQTEERMGCILCPKGHKSAFITVRKKYPRLYENVMLYYAKGSRRNGVIPESFNKWLTSIEDVPNEKFVGSFSPLAMTTDEMEREFERVADRELPLRVPYISSVTEV